MNVVAFRFLSSLCVAGFLLGMDGCSDEDAQGTSTPTFKASADEEGLELAPRLARLNSQDVARPRPIAGSWQGTVRQSGTRPFKKPVILRARIASLADPAENEIRYGFRGALCTGTWRYLGGDGSTARFREQIGRGTALCPPGVVSLRIDGSKLMYGFRGGGVVRSGLLSKAG